MVVTGVKDLLQKLNATLIFFNYVFLLMLF